MSTNHLIIGLGGTGGEIIRALRKTLFHGGQKRRLRRFLLACFGSAIPVASNATDDGREKNRRVEVWLK